MTHMNQRFYEEVVQGLSSCPKYLQSKYFYDQRGDELFRKIMRCPEYYLTSCEEEILSKQSRCITDSVKKYLQDFEVIGLGAGDGSKTIYLLKEFYDQQLTDAYYPVDISDNVIRTLEKDIPKRIAGLRVKGFNGEYLEMLNEINRESQKRKIVFFLGSNIGNYYPEEALHFCHQLYQHMCPGDLLLAGFDLKKHPGIILDAYNDRQGFTRDFNLNLLVRINRELAGNFDIQKFDHYALYDPISGSCKSFLVSLNAQKVNIGPQFSADFFKDEIIQMEVSQKYTAESIDALAERSGFKTIEKFYDHRRWFTDCLWLRE